MSLTINAKTYAADSFEKDKITYKGPNSTGSVRDDLKLARTGAKATSSFSGLSRTEAKAVRTLTLTGALTPTGDASWDLSVAVPVGAASADIDSLLTDFGAFASSANFKDHVKKQLLNF